MAFVVETGAGLANANSFASVAAADAYVADRGITGWSTLTTTAKEQALIRATDYLEATYRSAWKGFRNTEAQALSWPRYDVWVEMFLIDSDTVPSAVVRATIEMALKATTNTDLIPDTGRTITREKVDVIEIDYSEFGPRGTQFTEIARILSPYTNSSSGGAFASVTVIRT